jgi:hypothetical protein
MSDLRTQILLERIVESQREARRFIMAKHINHAQTEVSVCLEVFQDDDIQTIEFTKWLNEICATELTSLDSIGHERWCDVLYQHIALIFVHRYTHITITTSSGVGFTVQYHVNSSRK